jgi:hypothetical protein
MAHIFLANQLSLPIWYGKGEAKTWVSTLKDNDWH